MIHNIFNKLRINIIKNRDLSPLQNPTAKEVFEQILKKKKTKIFKNYIINNKNKIII